MAAILGLDEEEVRAGVREAAEGEVVVPGEPERPGQVVIAGQRDAVARAGERAKARGASGSVPLQVSAPFHCALMKPAEEGAWPRAARVGLARPARADRGQRRRRAEARPRGAIEALIRQVSAPVRWESSRAAPCVGGRHNVC